MIKLRTLLVAGLTLLLSGCKLAMLDPKGIIAASQKQLMIEATLLMLLIVVPVIILSFVIAWKFRASNTTAKYTPEWSHSTILEVIWWTIPCAIIAVLAYITWVTSHTLDPYRPIEGRGKTLTVQVIALDWKWLFIYPEQHIATVNELQLPVNVPVRFVITSDAPMNSFQIPQLAGQIYAMPGMQTKLHLLASEVGTYQGLSANFSGDGFSNMNFNVKVITQDQFDQWAAQAQRSPNKLTNEVYRKLAKPSEEDAVTYYSLGQDDVYNYAIMKFMGPGMPEMQHANATNAHSHQE